MLPSVPTPSAFALTNTAIVAGIMADDQAVIGAFYRQFEHRLRYMLARHCDRALEDVDDLVQEVFLISIRQIRRGDLRNTETLPAFLAIIAKRAAWSANEAHQRFDSLDAENGLEEGLSIHRPTTTPEQALLIAEKAAVMRKALTYLSAFHVEILTRFYLNGQKEEQIRAEMSISDNVFRVQKSRAKTKLAFAVETLLQGKTPKRYRELSTRDLVKAA